MSGKNLIERLAGVQEALRVGAQHYGSKHCEAAHDELIDAIEEINELIIAAKEARGWVDPSSCAGCEASMRLDKALDRVGDA